MHFLPDDDDQEEEDTDDDEADVVLSFIGRYHQFFNFQIHHLAGPSLGIQGGFNVSKYFVNGC